MTRIVSNFTRGKEGWSISGGVSQFVWAHLATTSPTGFLLWEDAATGEDSYWQAPAKFLRDLSASEGGRLSFAWYASDHGYQAADVLITGANGLTLAGDVADPGSDWSAASITLGRGGQWHVGTIDGPFASRREIAAVLADVTALQIRAEHVNGAEVGGLDAVKLVSRDPPPAGAFGEDRHGWFDDVVALPHHALDPHVQLV